ncbi:MAG: 4Fe-4S dicluster domain-containing protein [Clostridia bacterium]|nr:4Fe-4S dicluster domain-containing protein [Clostridia bacterium]
MAKSYRGGIPFVRKYASPGGAVICVPERIFLSLKGSGECPLSEGDTVKKYGRVFDRSENAPAVYAGVGGKVESIRRTPNRVDITLLTDAHAEVEAPFDAPEKNIADMSADELADLLLERGITPVKRGKRDPRTLTVDCGGSPYNDSRLYICRAFPEKVLLGAKIIMKLIGARTCNFAIPESDLNAAERIYGELPKDGKMFKISLIKDKLPATVPNLTLSALYSVEVNAAKDIFDAGYPVVSPLTCLSCYRALVDGIPFCEGFLTVAELEHEVDVFRVPFGTPLKEIADPSENERVIRGESLYGAELSGEVMTERVEAIAVMKNKPKDQRPTLECIKCRRCSEICPAVLSPIEIYSSVKHGRSDGKLALYAAGCFECRSCSYVCPSDIPLAETIIKLRRESGLISVEIDGEDPDFYDDEEEKEVENEH